MPKSLLIVAGEASGDHHGAALLRELREREPELVVYGLGGPELKGQGVELVADVSAISVIGLAEVVRVLPRARRIFRDLVARVEANPPDAALLIDFPEFNLRLARKLRALGVKVIYYVSPQVWAWRKGRVKAMARSIDRMLVFFSFEAEFYRGQLEVRHVGHPLVDEVPERPQVWDSGEASGPRRLVLLPGSRTSEIARILPVLLAAAKQMRRQRADLRIAVIEAANLDGKETRRLIRRSGIEVDRVAEADRHEAIASAHLALCASGTATLEVGLLRTPMIVVYRIGFFSYWLGRAIVDVPFISLVNLVLGEAVVPELIQREARPSRIGALALEILEKPRRRQTMRAGLSRLRPELGASGASGRAADEVASVLERAVA